MLQPIVYIEPCRIPACRTDYCRGLSNLKWVRGANHVIVIEGSGADDITSFLVFYISFSLV